MTNKINTLDWHERNCQQNRHFIDESKQYMRSLTEQASGNSMDNEQDRVRQQNQRFLQQIITAAVEDVEADTRSYEAECSRARKEGQTQFQRGQKVAA